VDNLPVALIPTFTELYDEGGEIERAALLVDAREGEQVEKLPGILRKLSSDHAATLVFVEASDEALKRRFSETRRPHPLGQGKSVAEGIREERRRMAPIRRLADVIIDTTKFNVHELHQFIVDRFQNPGSRPLLVSVVSFGFRYGIPTDADLVFDVRFLPNPNYIPRFKKLTGRHPQVARYIRSFPQTVEFIDRISELLIYLMPHYIREGKSYLTIAFGCTGGHHRSVMIADEIRKRLADAGFRVKATHRDMAKAV
jgi:UPF0042 nucleotide-binding protein